jgi:hypothetical protein
VVLRLAELWGTEVEEAARILADNTRRLTGLYFPPAAG